MSFRFTYSRPALEGTIGVVPRQKRSNGLEHATKINERRDRPWYDPVTHEAVPMDGLNRMAIEKASSGGMTPEQIVELVTAYEEAGEEEKAIALIEAYNRAVEREEPLGLSVVRNCDNVDSATVRRGLGGIPSSARYKIRIGCGIFARDYQRRCLSFITVTEPSWDERCHEIYASKNSEICRDFLSELRRQLRRKNMSEDLVHVKEIQEGRFRRYGCVSIHLHILCQGKKNRYDREWAMTKEWVRDVWSAVLKRYVGVDVDTKAATRVEVPRGSLLAEMSKYLSKGASVLTEVIEAGLAHHIPGQWWGMSRSLVAKLKRSMESEDPVISRWIMDNLSSLREQKLLRYYRIDEERVDQETGEIRSRPPGARIWFASEQAIDRVIELANEATYKRVRAEARELRVRELAYSIINRYYPGGYPAFQKWLYPPDETWAVRLNRRAI